ELVCPLVIARLVPTCRLSPGSHWMTPAGSFALAATVRVVDGIHRNASIYRTPSEPASTSRFADGNVLVIGITHLTHSRHAIDQHLAGLARRQLDQRVIAFLSDQLGRTTGRAHHLRAFSGLELDIVHRSTGRNVAQGKGV